ncbi:F-box protein At3g07870-like [Papaver somniferum]|uniref:F-box protein At3g07870-like n=1 Tax=Papaver somniferum TaxID=3469 RepID=UPI000E6F5188|nr:F-box protein At3g07870-like [Papaver somniferum]
MGYINNLPTDIILDILTRLLIESILEYKLVCRAWRNLVSGHPSFSQLHLSHLNHSAADSGKLGFLVLDDYQDFHYFEYNENNDDETPFHSITRININPPFRFSYRVVGSLNGLICLYEYKYDIACICNPLTKEYVLLPKVDYDHEFSHWSIGFGYNASTNEYKVVELYKLRGEIGFMEVAVYTLGNGKGWRYVGRLDTKFFNICYGDGVFAYGALHWMDKKGERVFVFNLTKEKFGEKLSPPHFPPASSWLHLPPARRRPVYTMGDFGEDLCCTIRYYSHMRTCLDIWLLRKRNDNPDMKEQVEHAPLFWSKECSHSEMEPLAFTNSGGVLCFHHRSC